MQIRNPTARFVIGLTFALLTCAAAARAEGDGNWPRFRGPNGSGVSEDAVPVAWTDKDHAWKIALPGTGHSSPVVWGDQVFVTAAAEEEGKRTLLCVNATDGAIRWRHDVELQPFNKHGENSFASSTPAVDDRHVYVAWTTPQKFEVFAINHAGKEIWRADLGRYRSQHGGGGSLIVHNGLVIANVDPDEGERAQSFVAALDAATGDVRWRTPRTASKFATSTPCVFRDGAGREQIVVTSSVNGFTALDPTTGHILWELPGAFRSRCVNSPVATSDMLFAGAGEGGRGECIVAVRPPREPGGNPEIAYKLTQEVPYVPTVIAHRDHVYLWSDAGVLACHVAATGERKWSERLKAKGGFFGSPISAGGKLYCVSKRGEVVVVSASPEKCEVVARNDLNEASHATPAVSKGRLYLRTVGHLICVAKSGEVGRAGP